MAACVVDGTGLGELHVADDYDTGWAGDDLPDVLLWESVQYDMFLMSAI